MPTFTGDQTANTLNGGADADTLIGNGGADTLNGGDGNDTIYGHSAGATSTITSTSFVTGLSQPVGAAITSADPGFLYVIEKASGVIWRIDEASGARTTFLDIPQDQFSSVGERGLLGIAFHPDYQTNGRYFVFVTDTAGDLQVREYHRAAGSNPPTSETTFSVIIDIPKGNTESNHNGGWIGFSPTDGYLYITTGDGGGSGDPSNNAQNTSSLLGKILRIDVNGDDFPADPNRNYGIPDDNPFVGVTGADEIWAYGLRNPWRIAFDPRNGDLYIADVGQGSREEVDYLPNGAGGQNFGWRIMEGTQTFNPAAPPAPQPGDPSLIQPIYEYGRGVGTSITGGEIYVGAQAGFVGQYVFADFGSGALFSLSVSDGAAVDATRRNVQISGPAPGSVVDFVSGSNGALYAIGIGGTIWRLTPGLGAEDVADTLNGGAGNDAMYGHAGNDVLDGGTGFDTSVYVGASTSATWTRNPNGTWTVTSGVEGTDTLTSVEFLDFTDRDVFLDRAASTFTGDGTSDIIVRNTNTGGLAAWFVSGGTVSAGGLGTVDSSWQIQGVGDFNGDGRDDIFWRNDGGGLAAWFMNGTASTGAVLGSTTNNWSVEAVGDFNGDGTDDVVWRESDGGLAAWFFNNGIATGGVLGSATSNWIIEGAADFNGDGRDDILWRDTSSGALAAWFMNGTSATGGVLGVVDAGWTVQGFGDLNGDGRDDILWRNSADALATWFMNGTVATGGVLGQVDGGWSVESVGDYNGDGRDDILWRNGDTIAAWYMNGTVSNGVILSSLSQDWIINPYG